jgi:hypothetical protein
VYSALTLVSPFESCFYWQRIKRWFWWHSSKQGSRVRRQKKVDKRIEEFKPKKKTSRAPQLIETYQKMFQSTVKTAIAAEKNREMERLGVTTLTSQQRMTIQRNVAQELFNAEPQEVKDIVMKANEEKKQELKAKREEEEVDLDEIDGSDIKDQSGNRTPLDYEKYVQ